MGGGGGGGERVETAPCLNWMCIAKGRLRIKYDQQRGEGYKYNYSQALGGKGVRPLPSLLSSPHTMGSACVAGEEMGRP